MQLPLPPGYQTLVPLDRDKHRKIGVADAKRGAFVGGLHGVHIFLSEFTHASRDYPIVFVREPSTGKFVSLAVTGLEPGKNLFVDAAGRWEDYCYQPGYVRRWPFFTAPLEGKGTPDKPESLVLVDESALSAEGEALFDAEGRETDAWKRNDALIRELEGLRPANDRFVQSLVEHRLLQPFEAHAFPKAGKDLHLTGMHRVDETRLNGLEGRVVKGLMKRGELSRIYAHLSSLDNFRHLMDRATARAALEK